MTYTIGQSAGSRGMSASGRTLERTSYGTLKAVPRAPDSVVESRLLTAPPLNPAVGNRWVPKAPAAGSWVGKEDLIAILTADGWKYETPNDGTVVWAKDEDIQIGYTGTAWTSLGVSAVGADATFNTYNFKKSIKLPDGTDPASILLGGFYIIKNPANAEGLTGDVWIEHIPHAVDTVLGAMQLMRPASDPSKSYIRTKSLGVWGAWKYTGLPDRLGPVGLAIQDWDLALDDGYYTSLPSSSSHAPNGFNYFYGTVENIGPLHVTQSVYALDGSTASTTTLKYRRDKYNGTFGPWFRVELSVAEMDARYAPISSAAPATSATRHLVGKSSGTFLYGVQGIQPISGTGSAVGTVVFDETTAAVLSTQLSFSQVSNNATTAVVQFTFSPALTAAPSANTINVSAVVDGGNYITSVSSVTNSGFVVTLTLINGAIGPLNFSAAVYA